jgi:hypothetical protein
VSSTLRTLVASTAFATVHEQVIVPAGVDTLLTMASLGVTALGKFTLFAANSPSGNTVTMAEIITQCQRRNNIERLLSIPSSRSVFDG